jgi:hypothetical protein
LKIENLFCVVKQIHCLIFNTNIEN